MKLSNLKNVLDKLGTMTIFRKSNLAMLNHVTGLEEQIF